MRWNGRHLSLYYVLILIVMIMRLRQYFLFGCILLLAACSDNEDTFAERSVASLYNEAMDQMYQQRYAKAAKLFLEVGYQHPYSWWAAKGELMSAFSYYKANAYDDATMILDRFIQLHPGNADIAYAYFLRAMCYYEQILDVKRDQRNTMRALSAFEQLRSLFPDSRYAGIADPKLRLLRDNLAGKDMTVGRFYQKKGYHLASILRFQGVVSKYSTTAHVREALYRMVESYLALGVSIEARRAAAVLGYNYPNDIWYRDAYALLSERGLISEDAVRYSQRGFDLSDYRNIYVEGSEFE